MITTRTDLPRRHWVPGPRWALLVAFGVGALVVSPLMQGWVEASLAGHMTQHMILVGTVGPLLALGSPAPRPAVGLGWLAAGVVAQTGTVLAWHVPVLFDAAEHNPALHMFEHACLVAGAWLLWWAAVWGVAPVWRGLGALATFVALLPVTLLGVGMTFASTPWYHHHRDLTDQQYGGVIMWAGGGTLALVAALALLVAWIASAVEEAQSA